jgi:hypothetical protein
MGPICILRVQFHPLHNSAKVYPNDTCSPSRTNKTRWARHASHADCGHGSGMKELYVRTSVRLPFFLSFCLSIRSSLRPSVHPSFFPSLTSPSSLAPFSLIYIFLVSFSGNYVIGLSVCVVMYILLPTCSSLICFIAKFFANFALEIYDFKFQPI